MPQYVYRAFQGGAEELPSPAFQEGLSLQQLALQRQQLGAQQAQAAAEQELARQRLAQQAQQFGVGNAMDLLQLASGREQSELARMFQAEQANLNRGFQGQQSSLDRRFQGRMDPFERELLQARAAQARASAEQGGFSAAEQRRFSQDNRNFAMKVRDYGNIKFYLEGEGVLPEQLGADVYGMASQLDPEWYRFAFGPVIAGRSPIQFQQQRLANQYGEGKTLDQLTKDEQSMLRRQSLMDYYRYVDTIHESLSRAMWERNGYAGSPEDYMDSARMLVPDPYASQRDDAAPVENMGPSTRPPVPSVAPENQPKPGRLTFPGRMGAGQRGTDMEWDKAMPGTPWSSGAPDIPVPDGFRPQPQPQQKLDLQRSYLAPFDPMSPPMLDLPPLPEGRQQGQIAPQPTPVPTPAPAPPPTPLWSPPPMGGEPPEGVAPRVQDSMPAQLRKYGPAAPAVRDAYLEWRDRTPAPGRPGGAELPERLRTFRNWEEMGMPGFQPQRDLRGSDSRLDQAMERNLAMLPEVTRRALAMGSPRDVTGMVIPSGSMPVFSDPRTAPEGTPLSMIAAPFRAAWDAAWGAGRGAEDRLGMDLNAMAEILSDMYRGDYERAKLRAERRARDRK